MFSRIFTVGMAVIGAAALADVLAHPQGTAAAWTGFNSFWKSSLQASSGQKIA